MSHEPATGAETSVRLTAQQAGAQLEDLLDRVHAIYRAERRATVIRVGLRARFIGEGQVVAEDSAPDCDGMLWGSGRSIKFDIKHCLEKIYRHDVRERAHQLMALWDAHETGAIAGLLVCNLAAGEGWWLRPRPNWAAGQFTPTPLEFDRVRCLAVPAHPRIEGIYAPDWLAAVKP